MRILIAGLPKSGTTGLLYLIANYFQERARLLFEPKVCPLNLDKDKRDIIAKVLIRPDLDVISFKPFEKKIAIVRDPRDRLVSSLLYSQYHAGYLLDDERVQTVKECFEKKETKPSSVSIRKMIEVISGLNKNPLIVSNYFSRVEKSLLWFNNYLSEFPNCFLYKYEDFVLGKFEELSDYLEITIQGKAEVPERLKRVNRTKSYGDWRNWFTDEDIHIFKPMMSSFLQKYGYDQNDWILNKQPYINPDHCSRYFMRLVMEQREKTNKQKFSGKVVRAEPNLIAGWIVDQSHYKPLKISLFVNGIEIAKSTADKPRPGIKQRGLHPTGLCGFSFRFDAEKVIQEGDTVVISTSDMDINQKLTARVAAKKIIK